MAKKQTKKTGGMAKKAKAKTSFAKGKKVNAKAKVAAIGKLTNTPTKTQILGRMAETADITQKQAGACLISLEGLIQACLKKGGPGAFVLPGLLKCQVIHKPATKARKGINPFTGEPTIFKAKPARNVVKVRPLKKLKEMAA
jgi:nucleoid DNA-binding protein